jgi:hypothetical protein
MAYINQDVYAYTNRFQNLRNWILFNLGYPLIRVELTQEHLTASIVDALTVYHKYAAIDYNFITVPATENPMDIPNDPTVTPLAPINKEMIVDIIYPASFFDSLGAGLVAGGYVGEFEGSVLPIFGYADGMLNVIKNFDLSKYYVYLQKLEDIKHIVGLEKTWEIVNNKIQIFPTHIQLEYIGILYKGRLTDAEIEEQDWIKKYSLARAKMMLGTIRSKLSGINAANMNLGADGESLKSEAKEEITALEEFIRQSGRPLPFIQI